MKVHGFVNAPYITCWAVGMGFQWSNQDWVVLATRTNGISAAVRGNYNGRLDWFGIGLLPFCTLDLDSVWVGRKYKVKDTGRTVIILLVGDGHVAFFYDDNNWKTVLTPEEFSKKFEPLPLESAETKLATVVIKTKLKTCGECDMFQDCNYSPIQLQKACEDFTPRRKCDVCGKPATGQHSKGVSVCDDCSKVQSPCVGVAKSPFGPILGEPDKLPKTVTCCDCGKPDMPIEDGLMCNGKWYCPTCANNPTEPKVDVMGQVEKDFDLVRYIAAQKEWSEKTFGPGPRTLGLIEHIKSELVEIEKAPVDLIEWVDVMILAFDGAWRAGHAPEQIIEALQKKQAKNFARQWPAPGPQDKANFHIKESTEAKPVYDQILHFLEMSKDLHKAVIVTRGGLTFCGQVVSIDSISKIFRIRIDGENVPFDWTDQDTKVNMPEPPFVPESTGTSVVGWKPEAGDWILSNPGNRVYVHGVSGKFIWVANDAEDDGWADELRFFRPRPAEPPKLKPCPYCGATPMLRTMIINHGKEKRYSVRCPCCKNISESPEDAAMKWNKRRVDNTLYVKIKTRLEEERDKAHYVTVPVLNRLLKDLETYAKENK
jgi:hypothetical protein